MAASFATPNLFLIALDLTKMQADTNVSESDIGGITEGKDATFSVDAYPGVQFSGTIRQVRLAPINVQNVVTYNVVVAVDNQDLRLKPGMTANVSIVVAQKEQILKVPNAALRFTPPKNDRAEGGPAEGKTSRTEGRPAGARSPQGSADSGSSSHKVWKQDEAGELVAVSVQTGISDGLATEVIGGELAENDVVVVGLDVVRGGRGSSELPPGFGGGGQRRTRDRGI